MIEPPIPADEERRIALLRACNIIYTPAEEAFDDIARLAADLCGAEIALITLVDSDYQWFKARVGVEQVGTPRDLSFCGHCINHPQPLVVEDTLGDPRFADNPLVTGEPKLRFYAGVPLLVDAGSSIGALSVADRMPRSITPNQLAALQRLAKQVSRELRLRRDFDRVAVVTAASELWLPAGTVVGGRWTVTREIGRGGSGAVFEAHDAHGERVAIKVLLPHLRANDLLVERFVREARVLMRIKTPHVGRLIDVGNLDAAHGSLPFLALEYLEGTDLDRVLAAKGRIPFREAAAWCADACEGVAEAHELGVIHRDLKPSNVFLADEGAGRPPTVKVLDFGIAAGGASDGSATKITRAGVVMGTPVYMAPEQVMSPGDVDARTDVWSMGAMFYELVTGALPFEGDCELQVFANVMRKPPRPMSAVLHAEAPPNVEAIVIKCLTREREARFGSMHALADALRAVAS